MRSLLLILILFSTGCASHEAKLEAIEKAKVRLELAEKDLEEQTEGHDRYFTVLKKLPKSQWTDEDYEVLDLSEKKLAECKKVVEEAEEGLQRLLD